MGHSAHNEWRAEGARVCDDAVLRIERSGPRRCPPSGNEDVREESHVTGHKRPSFLKRQKEQQRRARAVEKREARRARKRAKATEVAGPEVPEPPVEPPKEGEESGL